jgi:GTP-binding protein Era
MEHKAGFIGIVGKPNVGKSTFSNAFVGERLSIITAKAQTTRHRILGFMNDENYQLIISDTPGVIKPSYKLQEKMMDFVGEIFTDSDLILAMVSMDDPDLPDDIIEQLRKSEIPAYLLINKCDLSDQEKIIPIIAKYQALDIFENVFAISALNGLDREKLIEEILVHIPDHPPFYPKDQLTDKPERFFVEEMIREAIFEQFRQEIPYATQVEVIEFKEEPRIIKIVATIFAERQSQKGILVGPGGTGIRGFGTRARKQCENFFGKKIFLDLKVSVKKDWRKDEVQLKRFGYNKKK